MKTIQERFFEKVEYIPFSECWFWGAAIAMSWSYCNGKKIKGDLRGKFGFMGKNKFAHRISYMIHYGNIPEGKIVCHKCDNSLCVNPRHLYIGDHKSNSLDMVMRGRLKSRKGSLNPRAKLNEESVNFIRTFPKCNGASNKISEILGVSKSTINNVLYGRNWI